MTRGIETDEAGRLVLPPELLREMFGAGHPHARYFIEVHGTKIYISPERIAPVAEAEQSKPSIEQWEKQWRELTEEVSKVWPIGVSAVDVISEMRNARGQGFVLENEAGSEPENKKMLKQTEYCTLHKQASVKDCAIERITVHATGEDEIRFCYYKPNALGNLQLIMRPLDVPEEQLLQMFAAAVAEGIFTDSFREELKRVL